MSESKYPMNVEPSQLKGLKIKELAEMGEGWSLEPVPWHKRRHWLEISIVLWGYLLTLSGPVMGSQLLVQVGSWGKFIFVLLVAFAIMFITTFFHGVVGTKTGLNTTVLSRIALGHRGSYLYSIIVTGVTIVWFGTHVEIFTSLILNYVTFLEPYRFLFCIIVGGLMTFVAVLGYKGLAYLAYVAVPLVFIFLVWICVISGGWNPPTELISKMLSQSGWHAIGLGTAISMACGYIWQGAPDLCRFNRNTKEAGISVFNLYIVAIVFAFSVGALAVAGTKNPDVLWAIAIGLGLGAIIIIPAMLLEWTTNDVNLYMIGLALNNMFGLKDYRILIVIGGAIGTFLGVLGILHNLLSITLLISISVPPLMALTVTDYWVVGRKDLKKMFEYTEIPLNIHGIISWVIGFIVGYYTPGIIPAVIPSFIATGLVYYILMKAHGIKYYDNIVAERNITIRNSDWKEYIDQTQAWKSKGWV